MSLTSLDRILSRAHSNYLAQINILMNERQEQTADVLGKLTVLGTIVLPMNIICGMWGMNVKVPGQDIDNLSWFWSSKSSLSPFLLLPLKPFSYGRFVRLCLALICDCQTSLQDCVDKAAVPTFGNSRYPGFNFCFKCDFQLFSPCTRFMGLLRAYGGVGFVTINGSYIGDLSISAQNSFVVHYVVFGVSRTVYTTQLGTNQIMFIC